MSASKTRPAGNTRQPLPVRAISFVRAEIFRLVSYLPFLAIKVVWWPVGMIGASPEAVREQINRAIVASFCFAASCFGYWVLSLNGVIPTEGWVGFVVVALTYVLGADKEAAYNGVSNWASRNFTRSGLKSRIAYLVSRLFMLFDHPNVKAGIVGLIDGAALATLAGWLISLFT